MVTTAKAITTIYTCKKLDTVEITKITSQFYLMDINLLWGIFCCLQAMT